MDKRLIKFMLTIISAAIVVGCSGGGGGGGPVAGIDRLGVSLGTVTGFGSIFVNGVEFETDSAEFEIDDDSIGSSQDDLAVGDVVIVAFNPSVSSTTATIVFSEEAVEGPIDSFDTMIGVVNCNLVVAGQCVIVDGGTSFDDSISPASVAGLMQDDFVEVSGLFDSNGNIRATRIEPGAGEVEVHGKVSGLNTGTKRFMISTLMVNYGTADTGDLPGGMPVEDGLVEVKGAIDAGGFLVASKVEPDGLDAVNVNPDDFDEVEVEIEGLITRFFDEFDFDVAGFPVITNGGTTFEGGTAGDLTLNVKVEVEGDLNGADVLVAKKVDIRRGNDLRVTALVDQVPPVSAAGTIVVLGITVHIDALTRFEDKSNAKMEPFGLNDIGVGNYVEVRGGTIGGGTDILASRLEREDIPNPPGSNTELRGLVENSIANPNFTIAGVTIVTDPMPGGTVYRNVAGTSIGAVAFFAALQPGDLVDADGSANGAILTANEVQLEN